MVIRPQWNPGEWLSGILAFEPGARVQHSPSLDLFICSSLQGSLRPSRPFSFLLGNDDPCEAAADGAESPDGCAVLKSLLQILGPVQPADSFQL